METGDHKDHISFDEVEETIREATEQSAAYFLMNPRIRLWMTFDSCETRIYGAHELRAQPAYLILVVVERFQYLLFGFRLDGDSVARQRFLILAFTSGHGLPF
jgi:hypothetical protein